MPTAYKRQVTWDRHDPLHVLCSRALGWQHQTCSLVPSLVARKQPSESPGIWGMVSPLLKSLPPQVPSAISVFWAFLFCAGNRLLYRFSLRHRHKDLVEEKFIDVLEIIDAPSLGL